MAHSSPFQPSESTVSQITRLSEMSMDDIRSLWRDLYQKEPPTHIRSFLEKRLAFRLQEVEFNKKHQDITDRNNQRIKALLNPKNTQYQIVPGTVLSRIYKDKMHLVTATHDGQFNYEGKTYKSLSVIAREITGTRWSGPLFFGLRKTSSDKKQKQKQKQK